MGGQNLLYGNEPCYKFSQLSHSMVMENILLVRYTHSLQATHDHAITITCCLQVSVAGASSVLFLSAAHGRHHGVQHGRVCHGSQSHNTNQSQHSSHKR